MVVEVVAAGLLVVVGVIHSLLGEKALIGPLLADPSWSVGIPRGPADLVLRFAWHLTSLAWWAVAATLLGVDPALAFGLMCVTNAVIILWILPGHLAWPPFLGAGLLALWTADVLPAPVLRVAVGVAVVGALVAAGFHVAWAAGRRSVDAHVLPERTADGEPLWVPGRLVTLAVAGALVTFAAVLAARALGAGGALVLWADAAALAVLSVRVMGDGRWVGVLKSVRGTAFARADDRYWTPAVAVLALGALAALAL